MNIFRDRPNGSREVIDSVVNIGEIDYVQDGKIHKSSPLKAVQIRDGNDLELLESYETGTIAYTAGFKSAWQKSEDGTWESII